MTDSRESGTKWKVTVLHKRNIDKQMVP